MDSRTDWAAQPTTMGSWVKPAESRASRTVDVTMFRSSRARWTASPLDPWTVMDVMPAWASRIACFLVASISMSSDPGWKKATRGTLMPATRGLDGRVPLDEPFILM